MAKRIMFGTATAVLLALVAACSQSRATLSPSTAIPGAGAAADGSTLKVTAPSLTFPIGGNRIDTLEPVFRIGPATARFTETPALQYRIEVYDASGKLVMNSPKLSPASNGQSSWEYPALLELDSRYRWRARAELGSQYGPWSGNAEFLSLDYRGIIPRPPGGNWPTDPEAVVEYIMDVFPEYLQPTALTAQRIANMEFLRDRVIEAGICGGLDVAHNLKRGIGPWSTDAIAWRINGKVEVVDIASAFDDKTIPLVLHWVIVEGPPGFDPYPNHPGC